MLISSSIVWHLINLIFVPFLKKFHFLF